MVGAGYCKIKNFIVDAERHRRTPRLSAISGKMVDVWAAGFLRAVADSMRDAGRNWRRCHYSTIKFRNRKIKAIWLETILQNGWLNHSNIMPKPSKYHCRRRATPPHPRDTGTWSKVIESQKSANIGDAGAARNWKKNVLATQAKKRRPKTCQNH